jgi:putative heme-binding domain-containing protein
MIGYSGQAPGIAELLSAMPAGNDNQELQLQYLYGLRMIEQGWTTEQKTRLAEILGRAAKWRGGAQFINFVGQFYDAVADLYATDEEKQILFEKAPEFSPLTPQELEAIQARQAAAGRGGRGGRGGPATPLAARTQGRVVSRQEMLEEAVYQPQQNLSADEGRKVFEANCASCHRFGNLGNDHGVASLNLSTSPLRSAKYSLLEAVMFPDRKLAAEHETTVIATTDGKTIPGLVLRETAQSVSLLTREGTETDVAKAQIKSRQKEKTSLMTEAMADAMNQAQWRNLLAFLTAPPPGTQP